MTSPPPVFIVDDDATLRDTLGHLLRSLNHIVHACTTAREFLDTYTPGTPGCLVLDVRLPGMSGLELLELLVRSQSPLAVIIITAFADVPMAVRALKAGALDFLEKPVNLQALLDRIHQGAQYSAGVAEQQAERAAVAARLAQLTPRERQVLDHVLEGLPNREIARLLEISIKTVESARARMMDKMAATSVPHLGRMMSTQSPQ